MCIRDRIDAHPSDSDAADWYAEACTDAGAFEHHKNMVLLLYTDDKLRRQFKHAGRVNYDVNRQHTPTAKCLLLREMIAVMNSGSPVQPSLLIMTHIDDRSGQNRSHIADPTPSRKRSQTPSESEKQQADPPPVLQSFIIYIYFCKSGGWKISLKPPSESEKQQADPPPILQSFIIYIYLSLIHI